MSQSSNIRAQAHVLSVTSSVAFDRLDAEDSGAKDYYEGNPPSMKDTESVNGFQRDELDQLKKQLQSHPDAAKFKLRAKSRWIDGAQSLNLVSSFHGMGREFTARSTPFIQTTDTPTILLGKDGGPSPMEEIGRASCRERV